MGAMWSFDNQRQFASDNNAGICPEVLGALQNLSAGHVGSYGSDPITEKAKKLFRELFETDCDAYFVFNGTGANSLAIGSFCLPHHSVFCHRFSHLETDECNAPGFLNQGLRILAVEGADGKIDSASLQEALRGRRDIHASQPRVVSLTNTTELGTLYRPDEIAGLADLAKSKNLVVHMDGARFANAVASAGCAPAELTWKADEERFGLWGSGRLLREKGQRPLSVSDETKRPTSFQDAFPGRSVARIVIRRKVAGLREALECDGLQVVLAIEPSTGSEAIVSVRR
jgi:threonine aldolase